MAAEQRRTQSAGGKGTGKECEWSGSGMNEFEGMPAAVQTLPALAAAEHRLVRRHTTEIVRMPPEFFT